MRYLRPLLLTFLVPAFAAAAPAKDANAHYDLGLAQMKKIEPQLRAGKLSDADQAVAKEAEAEFEAALAQAPDHGRAHIMLGMLLNFTKRYPLAEPHLKKGLGLPKDSQDWWIAGDTLVNVYFNQNLPAPAVAVLEPMVEQRPSDVQARFKLGLAYLFTQRKPEAITSFKRVLELQPDHAQAKAQLAKLEPQPR